MVKKAVAIDVVKPVAPENLGVIKEQFNEYSQIVVDNRASVSRYIIICSHTLSFEPLATILEGFGERRLHLEKLESIKRIFAVG